MSFRLSMLKKVFLSLFLAVIVGYFTGNTLRLNGVLVFEIYGFLGQLFLNALTLLVVPLIASSIIHGIGNLGKDASFKRLGFKTFTFYVLTTLLAILTGLVLVNTLKPGLHYQNWLNDKPENVTSSALSLLSSAPQDHFSVLKTISFKLIPTNIFEAASQGNMLGIIFFSLLFAFALSKIEGGKASTLTSLFKNLFSTLMRMTHFVIAALPYGVFFLVAKVVAEHGIGSIEALFLFFLTVILGLASFMFLVIPLLLWARGIDPWKHFKALAPALLTAFSTSSSAATLPITMECVEKRAGVSNRICSFVVPLGTSVNMSGSALYECVATLFIAQVYGVDLSFLHQAIIVVLSLLTSMGVAGIPSASLVAIMIILNTMGLPAEGLALILPVDRILDMCRTTTNVLSDCSCAVLVAKSEGEILLSRKKNVR